MQLEAIRARIDIFMLNVVFILFTSTSGSFSFHSYLLILPVLFSSLPSSLVLEMIQKILVYEDCSLCSRLRVEELLGKISSIHFFCLPPPSLACLNIFHFLSSRFVKHEGRLRSSQYVFTSSSIFILLLFHTFKRARHCANLKD